MADWDALVDENVYTADLSVNEAPKIIPLQVEKKAVESFGFPAELLLVVRNEAPSVLLVNDFEYELIPYGEDGIYLSTEKIGVHNFVVTVHDGGDYEVGLAIKLAEANEEKRLSLIDNIRRSEPEKYYALFKAINDGTYLYLSAASCIDELLTRAENVMRCYLGELTIPGIDFATLTRISLDQLLQRITVSLEIVAVDNNLPVNTFQIFVEEDELEFKTLQSERGFRGVKAYSRMGPRPISGKITEANLVLSYRTSSGLQISPQTLLTSSYKPERLKKQAFEMSAIITLQMEPQSASFFDPMDSLSLRDSQLVTFAEEIGLSAYIKHLVNCNADVAGIMSVHWNTWNRGGAISAWHEKTTNGYERAMILESVEKLANTIPNLSRTDYFEMVGLCVKGIKAEKQRQRERRAEKQREAVAVSNDAPRQQSLWDEQ